MAAVLLTANSSAWAQDIAEQDCPMTHYEKDGKASRLNITRMWAPKTRNCEVIVTDKDASASLRKFSLSSSGLFQVNNDYGRSGHGSRAFFLFPRKEVPSFVIKEAEGVAIVTLTSGHKARFSIATGKLISVSGTLFTEAKQITKTNAGGFEFNAFDGVILDTGFQMSAAAFSNPKGTTLVRDHAGASCKVKNSELFNYTYLEEVKGKGKTKTVKMTLENARLKFATDADLAAFLEGNADCQNLDLSSIRPVVVAPEPPAPSPGPAPAAEEPDAGNAGTVEPAPVPETQDAGVSDVDAGREDTPVEKPQPVTPPVSPTPVEPGN